MNGEWQWMQKTGVLSFKNPHKDATFYLESDAVPSNFDKPQQVTVWVGTAQVGAFAADSKDPVLRRLPITAAQFGAGDMAELRIEVDRTFIPALLPAATSHDTRELGIRVYHAFIEPK
jgi:hypothetical protein